jgi:hypothetical protein
VSPSGVTLDFDTLKSALHFETARRFEDVPLVFEIKIENQLSTPGTTIQLSGICSLRLDDLQ